MRDGRQAIRTGRGKVLILVGNSLADILNHEKTSSREFHRQKVQAQRPPRGERIGPHRRTAPPVLGLPTKMFQSCASWVFNHGHSQTNFLQILGRNFSWTTSWRQDVLQALQPNFNECRGLRPFSASMQGRRLALQQH